MNPQIVREAVKPDFSYISTDTNYRLGIFTYFEDIVINKHSPYPRKTTV